ncbi:O-methyltransferase [Leptospira ilyithenensis]|uniref:O-methyltransferase n=2 Tax=Leptospira ilyithenensis TaxID=2484901 RepID=A0A4R9LVJ6_9LEPT|nr:O-methyltransferase [Leptospira ilyithenensis]
MKPRPSIFRDHLEDHMEENYVLRPHSLFYEMEDYAKENSIPIVSAATGKVLSHLLSLLKPKSVWELGTGIGYSTLWMAYGSPGSEIITIDRNGSQASLLDGYKEKWNDLRKTEIKRITSWCMDFMYENIDLWSDVDLFFIDCDKVTYPQIWELLSTKAKPGAKIIYDNVLWHGRILDSKLQKPSDVAIKSFWEKVKDSKYPFTLYPVGDGLLFIEKP